MKFEFAYLGKNKLFIPLLLVLGQGLFCCSVGAEVKVGMTTALSGPASALGQGVKLGVETYFNKVNTEGGVKGQKLALVALDDGYEPAVAAPNMLKLVKEEKVIAVLGNVGTPTAIVTVPIANEMKTPLIGAFTGAGVLRKSPPDRYIINYRASYAEETAAMVKGLLDAGIKPQEIAFFTQNDGYGDAGYNGAVKALNEHGFTDTAILAHGRYTRNTTNVEEGLGTLFDAEVEPKAVIMVGSYKPCAAFIKAAKAEFPDLIYLNVSFVGSAPLLADLGTDGEGVIVTQVVPHFESNLPGVAEYRAELAKFSKGSKPDFVSLEGYLSAKLLVAGLKNAPALDREGIVEGIESLSNFDLGVGSTVTFSKTVHQASHQVWTTIIKNQKYVALDWSTLK